MPLLVVGYGPGNAHAIAKRFGVPGTEPVAGTLTPAEVFAQARKT